jgi:hypothetical protein
MQPFSYGITQNLAENHNLLVSHMFEERVSRASPQILMEFDGIGFSYKLLRSRKILPVICVYVIPFNLFTKPFCIN